MKMLYAATVSLVFLLIIRMTANEIHHSSEQHILHCVRYTCELIFGLLFNECGQNTQQHRVDTTAALTGGCVERALREHIIFRVWSRRFSYTLFSASVVLSFPLSLSRERTSPPRWWLNQQHIKAENKEKFGLRVKGNLNVRNRKSLEAASGAVVVCCIEGAAQCRRLSCCRRSRYSTMDGGGVGGGSMDLLFSLFSFRD